MDFILDHEVMEKVSRMNFNLDKVWREFTNQKFQIQFKKWAWKKNNQRDAMCRLMLLMVLLKISILVHQFNLWLIWWHLSKKPISNTLSRYMMGKMLIKTMIQFLILVMMMKHSTESKLIKMKSTSSSENRLKSLKIKKDKRKRYKRSRRKWVNQLRLIKSIFLFRICRKKINKDLMIAKQKKSINSLLSIWPISSIKKKTWNIYHQLKIKSFLMMMKQDFLEVEITWAMSCQQMPA